MGVADRAKVAPSGARLHADLGGCVLAGGGAVAGAAAAGGRVHAAGGCLVDAAEHPAAVGGLRVFERQPDRVEVEVVAVGSGE